MNNCESFEARLNDVLDLRQAPAQCPDLQAHAGQCDHCRRLLDTYLVMLEGVTELGCGAPLAGFAKRIASEVENDRWNRRSRARALGSLVAAAALLLAAFWGLRSTGPDLGPPNQKTQFADRSLKRPELPTAALAADIESKLQRPSGSLFEEAAQGSLTDLVLLFPGIAPNAAVLGGEMNGRTSPAADWLTEMTEGFKPVSDSTSGALNELADAFPLEGDPGL